MARNTPENRARILKQMREREVQKIRDLGGHIDCASNLASEMYRVSPEPLDPTSDRLNDLVEKLEVCLALAKEARRYAIMKETP